MCECMYKCMQLFGLQCVIYIYTSMQANILRKAKTEYNFLRCISRVLFLRNLSNTNLNIHIMDYFKNFIKIIIKLFHDDN